MNQRLSNQKKQPYQIKGVDALFGADALDAPNTDDVRTISLNSIELPNRQPRRYFDPTKQAELVASIQEHGILQPLIVRPSSENKGKYELIIGERRYRAAKTLNLKTVPVIVKTINDETAWELALLENLQREDLNPVEETEAIIQLLQSKLKITGDELVKLLNAGANKERDSVNNVMHSEQWQQLEALFKVVGRFTPNSFRVNRLPLLKLPADILTALREGRIEYTKAKAIAKLDSEDERSQLLQKAIEEDMSLNQIKEYIDALRRQENVTSFVTPVTILNDTYRGLKKSQLWKTDPKKWRKAETLLKRLNELLSDPTEELTK